MPGRPLRVRPLAIGLAPFAALALVRLSVFAEGDTFWGVRTGQQILATHSVHLRDDLSWTRFGVAWHPNEWGYDVALWVAYRLGGIAGLQVFLGITIVALGVVVVVAAHAFRVRLRDGYWVSLFLGPLLLGWLSARAQTVSYSFQLLELLLIARLFTARGLDVWRWGVALLVLQAVWLNIHEAAASGIVVAAGCAVVRGVSLLRRRELDVPSALRLAAAPGLVLVGSLCGPFGWSVFADSERTRAASAGVIVEWDSVLHAPATVLAELGVGVLLVALMVAVWRRERGSDLEALSDVWLGAAIVLSAASLVVVRFVAPLLLVGIVAATAVTRADRISQRLTSYRRLLDVGAAVVAALLTAVGVVQLTASGEPTAANFPSVRLLDAIPPRCVLLNEYDDGGWISLQRGPALRVSQDGRNVLYGRALLGREQALLDGRAGAAALTDFGATCVLAKPDDAIVRDLAADPRWVLAARDARRVLYERTAIADR